MAAMKKCTGGWTLTTSLLVSAAANVGSYSPLRTTLRKKKLETNMLVAASSVLLLTLSCYDIYVFATRALPLERPVPTATGQPTSTT